MFPRPIRTFSATRSFCRGGGLAGVVRFSGRRLWGALLVVAVASGVLLAAPLGGVAWAQRPGGFGPSGAGPGGPGGKPEEKKGDEGPAEAAPKKQSALVIAPPGYPAEKPGLINFELHGYFRFRWDLLHQFNLGYPEATATGNPRVPFPLPVSERLNSTTSCFLRTAEAGGCQSNTFISANMRLRLEPTLTISEEVKIHMQIDLLDNLVLGSTPDNFIPGQAYSSLNLGTTSQVSPNLSNSFTDSVKVKRAYAEVKSEIGTLFFGRMPSHWGMGMLFNAGDQRSNCGTDCNYGDTADRIMFVSTPVPELTVGIGYEFTNSGLSSANLAYTGQTLFNPGQPFNADRIDDVTQYLLFLRKAPVGRTPADEERIIRERADAGETVFNYGFHFVYRKQAFDQNPINPVPALGTNPMSNAYDTRADPNNKNQLIGRSAFIIIPDLWARVLVGRFRFEAEAAFVLGSIGTLGGNSALVPTQTELGIVQFGGVVRSNLRLLNDDLHINLEIGYASGDQSEQPVGQVGPNIFSGLPYQPAGDNRITNFRFNYDYRVDMILFREILGSVTNATYFKPGISYELSRTFGAHLDFIYSLANVPVATPGNSPNLGLELDLGLYYQNRREGFFAALDWGVLFPFQGLARLPSAGMIEQTPNTAQALRARLVIPF